MAKIKRSFVCTECGGLTPKWQGRCNACGAWNTLVEEVAHPPKDGGWRPGFGSGEPVSITEVQGDEVLRQPTTLPELDRVLGGGVVPGSLVLVAGDPGIGKSTLLMQMADGLSRQTGPVLYVSGEESLSQIRLRAGRLGTLYPQVYLDSEIGVQEIIRHLEKLRPTAAVIDSIQTVYSEEIQSAPGSVAQVRESAAYLLREAKRSGVAIFLVGHVTKQGSVAGPQVLMHMVDTVLTFEGDRHQNYRILRATKNRFGPAQEMGVFEMRGDGLVGVSNPSEFFLSERSRGGPGAVVTASVEGTRPLLVEVQALVASSAAGGHPRRLVTGADPQRVNILLAVLEKRLEMGLNLRDVYVNLVGGVRVEEPGCDLAVALALVSSLLERPLNSRICAFGEVGLLGEVRGVTQSERRIGEAAQMGFNTVILPASSSGGIRAPEGVRLVGVRRLSEALEAAGLGGERR